MWHRYDTYGDEAALHTLLEYNREDVVNLALLENHLGIADYVEPSVSVRLVLT